MAAELEGDSLPSVENVKIHEEVKKNEVKPIKVDKKTNNEKELEDFLMG
jgi:hypothetical protein